LARVENEYKKKGEKWLKESKSSTTTFFPLGGAVFRRGELTVFPITILLGYFSSYAEVYPPCF